MGKKVPFDFITTRTSHPLDKGWSWIIMLAAFGSQFLVIGYQRSFGLMFVAFQERYEYSAGLLSMVNGTQMLTYSFSTMLVMNYLLKKISVRTSCLLGACFQAAGIVACSLYSNMTSLIICQGFLFGLGHSMLYCPTLLILSQYFDRHRSIATAVATCGAGAGGIAFPYITRFLLNVFGLDGALLLLGALIFHQSVFYALFQPIVIGEVEPAIPEPLSRPKEHFKNDLESQLHENNNNNNLNSSCTIIPCTVIQKHNQEGTCDHLKELTPANYVENNTENNNLSNDFDEKDTLFKGIKVDSLLKHSRFGQQSLSSSQILQPKRSREDVHRLGRDKLYSSHGVIPANANHINRSLSQQSRELLCMLGGSTNGIHSSLPAIVAPVRQQETYDDANVQSVAEEAVDVKGENKTMMCEVSSPVDNVEDVAALSLLADESDTTFKSDRGCIPAVMRLPSFWLVAVYIIGGIIAAGCPAIYIPPLSKEKGLTNADATFFLTISATTDFLGRIGSGLVLHFKLIEPCNLALIPLGLSTLFFNLTPIFNDFDSVLLLTLQYGLASSMFWTLMSLVIIDVLGLANLGSAMGFYAVINGLTTSASYPFAGWLYDETGSFSSSFHYFGTMSFVAALALLAILLPRYRRKCMG